MFLNWKKVSFERLGEFVTLYFKRFCDGKLYMGEKKDNTLYTEEL